MRALHRTKFALPIISLAAMTILSGCASSSDSNGSVATDTDAGVEAGVGAMSDASFAVTVFLDTIWPIEGNDYAEPAIVEEWCATYATDPAAAVAAIAEYLSSEPDIAVADPESVSTAAGEYLEGNCYLLEE